MVEKITVIAKPVPWWRHQLATAIGWGQLVGVIGLSHWWFGGSWIIDIMALVIMVTTIVNIMKNAGGAVVTMTHAEIRQWVTAGMPDDVNEWRKDGRMRIISPGRN